MEGRKEVGRRTWTDSNIDILESLRTFSFTSRINSPYCCCCYWYWYWYWYWYGIGIGIGIVIVIIIVIIIVIV